MSGSQVLLTYKRKRLSRTDPVRGHECRNSLFVAPDDTSLSKPPDLQVHLIDKHSSEHYNRNSAVCHVCFVCYAGGNPKHCGKCLQYYNLQCLDKPHKEKEHIEVSGTRQIPIKTVPTSLDEVPSQRDACGNKSSGKKVGSSSNANAGALVDDKKIHNMVYVDDILVTGNCNTACRSLISLLSAKFPVKDLGPLHYFLGLEVHRSGKGIFLSQTKYACDLLKKTDFIGASPCSTPLGSYKLDNCGDILADATFYCSTVGALQYLTWTRPDLSYAVNLVCQHLHQPRSNHLGAVKRILRYLKGTLDMGVWFTKGSLTEKKMMFPCVLERFCNYFFIAEVSCFLVL
ncbi:unnamed protein product [Prunus brigantina]